MRGQGRVVTHENQSAARVFEDAQKEIEKGIPILNIQGGGRLVDEEKLRCIDQRPNDRYALLLADAQLSSGPAPQVCGQVYGIEESQGVLSGLPAGSEVRCQEYVIEDGQVGDQVELLEHDADVPGAKAIPLPGAQTRELCTQNGDHAFRRQDQSGQEAQEGGLTAARGSLKEHALAGGDLPGGNLQHRGRLRVITETQVLQGQGRGRAGHRKRVCSAGGADDTIAALFWIRIEEMRRSRQGRLRFLGNALALGKLLALLFGAAVAIAEPRTLTWLDLLPANEVPEGFDAFDVTEQVRPELNRQEVRIPGYIVPLEFDEERRVTKFLLVPYFGACIHEPPPPPNQTIYAEFASGVTLGAIFDPFWIEGRMHTSTVVRDIATASYSMDIAKVEPYTEP